MLLQAGVDWLGFPLCLELHREDLPAEEASRIVASLGIGDRAVLITYLADALAIARLAAVLAQFPAGLYVTDLYPDFQWHRIARAARLFKSALSVATRARVTLHFGNEAAIRAGFHDAGFTTTRVHLPESYYGVLPIPVQRTPSFVRVVESRVEGASTS